jgi:hypothetical protein
MGQSSAKLYNSSAIHTPSTTGVLNLLITTNNNYTPHLVTSPGHFFRFNAGVNRLAVVRARKITRDIEFDVLMEAESYTQINVLLTEDFDVSALDMLNGMIRDKIATMIVVACASWDNLHSALVFCPRALFVITSQHVDVRKFGHYHYGLHDITNNTSFCTTRCSSPAAPTIASPPSSLCTAAESTTPPPLH